MTALHYAAKSGHVKIVKYLVKQHASIDIKAHGGGMSDYQKFGRLFM